MKKYYSEVRVLYADTDAMGVVYHTNYIRWFEIGRNEYLRQLGFPYVELEADSIWLPLSSVFCEYKKAARYDDVIEIAAWVDEMTFATITIAYELTRKSDGEILVTGYSVHAITDDKLNLIRLSKVHPEFHAALKDSIED